MEKSHNDSAPGANYGGTVGGVMVKAKCIGDTRYRYVVGQPKIKLGQTDNLGDPANPTLRHLLWVDKKDRPEDLCKADGLAFVDQNKGRELLAQNMRLISFDVSPAGDNVNINIKVYYGDYDLAGGLAGNGTASCESTKNGGQFCASSELSTVVRRRI